MCFKKHTVGRAWALVRSTVPPLLIRRSATRSIHGSILLKIERLMTIPNMVKCCHLDNLFPKTSIRTVHIAPRMNTCGYANVTPINTLISKVKTIVFNMREQAHINHRPVTLVFDFFSEVTIRQCWSLMHSFNAHNAISKRKNWSLAIVLVRTCFASIPDLYTPLYPDPGFSVTYLFGMRYHLRFQMNSFPFFRRDEYANIPSHPHSNTI